MVADRLTRFAVAAVLASMPAFAQAPSLKKPRVSFTQLRDAESSTHYHLTQFRFARNVDANGNVSWVGLTEELSVAPHATGQRPRFDLKFLGAIGLDPVEENRQRTVHHEHRGFLHLFGSFRVHDVKAARNNYTIRYDSSKLMLGRPTHRFRIEPKQHVTGSSWVVDVDSQTNYPLRRAEYAPNGDLVSALTVTSFTHGPAAQTAIGAQPNWWSPAHRTWYGNLKSAVRATGVLVKPVKHSPAYFTPTDLSVTLDPVTGSYSYIHVFSNGIECIHLMQKPNTPPTNLTAAKTPGHHTMFDFSDLNSTQLLFNVDNTEYIVIGASNNTAVGDFADETLRQAIR